MKVENRTEPVLYWFIVIKERVGFSWVLLFIVVYSENIEHHLILPVMHSGQQLHASRLHSQLVGASGGLVVASG